MPGHPAAPAAPIATLFAAAGSAALVVTAAAVGGARPLVIAGLALVGCLGATTWAARLLRRHVAFGAAARTQLDAIVGGLRSALDGEETGPVSTGDEALDRLVSAVLDGQRDAAEAAIDLDRQVLDWTGCVQRLAEGDLARDVSFSSEDELGSALALLQGRQREFAEAARRIADGDLTVQIEAWSERDLMGFALGGMVAGLRTTVGELRSAAVNIEESSSSMTSVSGEVSRGMEEVAVQTGQLAAGAERQVQVLHATRADAELAATSATDALDVAAAGVQSVELADGTMQSLASASHEVRDAIHSLSERSARIVDFVAMITRIADQTNLLALNAAIEAARAGDHGRGFAVVADEVRKLAVESQDSAGQIAVLVAEIQEDTDRTVEVVERTAARAVEGTEVVGQARDAFAQIRAAVDDASTRVAGILGSLEQVSEVAVAASLSTEAVSAATEQTSASMEELDASAAETARMSEVLSEVAGRFQLPATEAAVAEPDAELYAA